MVIEESVLRYQLGDAEIMAAQLGHLLSILAVPSVSLGVIPFAPSPRQVTPGQAAQLAALAPPGILRIAVAQHPLQMKVDEICRILKPDYFQTDVEDLRELKIPAHIKVLPVVRFGRKTPNPLPARMRRMPGSWQET